jgi:hypothetical protein
MATKKLLSQTFNIHNATQFLESLSEPQNDSYYIFFGKHTPFTVSDNFPDTAFDSQRDRIVDVYNEMTFGKIVANNDVQYVTRKVIYSGNTTFAMYDDQDVTLFEKDFYAAVHLGSNNYNVYKCLFNNKDQPTADSGAEPTGTTGNYEETSDQYVWRYMYSIDSDTWAKFSTSNFMPVFANANISSNAIPGTVEIIKINDGGTGYNNYFNGSLSLDQIRYNGDSLAYLLGATASSFNDFYTGCVIRFETNNNEEYRVINDYVVASGVKKILIDSPLTIEPQVGTNYQIFPQIKVIGDGSESSNCLAWGYVNASSSNTVYKAEVIPGQEGEGYRFANAFVVADASVGVTLEANCRAIISPLIGHGNDPVQELFGNRLCVSVKISNNESNNIISNNDFRTLGILKNPKFANVNITHGGGAKVFDIGETVFQYVPIQVVGTAAVNTASSNTILTGTNTLFNKAFQINDHIVISNGSASFYNVVNSIANSTQITLKNAITSNIASMNVALMRITAQGTVTAFSSGNVQLTSANGSFATNADYIGTESMTYIVSTGVLNNGRNTNSFRTFMQLTRLEGSTVGTFTQDELVFDETLAANSGLRPEARVFFANTTEMYVTQVTRPIEESTVLRNSNNVTFSVENKYDGDLVKDSGEVLYFENLLPVSKTDTTSETIKIVLEF